MCLKYSSGFMRGVCVWVAMCVCVCACAPVSVSVAVRLSQEEALWPTLKRALHRLTAPGEEVDPALVRDLCEHVIASLDP